MTGVRLLHVLSQRPSHTGSGMTLQALVRHGPPEQHAVVGTPRGEAVALGIDTTTVVFEEPPLDFPLPGMSDVMPYPSSRWSSLSEAQLARYRDVWRETLAGIVARFRPDVIHSHHLWLVSRLVAEVAPDVRRVVHCHATGLRQMELCPGLADEVVRHVRSAHAILTLSQHQTDEVVRRLDYPRERVHVVGSGYREDTFHARGREATAAPLVTYAGKLSFAKGLPWLLDAFARVRERWPEAELHVAGDGAGPEADALRERLTTEAGVTWHGFVSADTLATLLRRSAVFVLPSFYEGVPLVLVEAAACGCQLVATALPGVHELAPGLGDRLRMVTPPRLDVDVPDPRDLPAFGAALTEAIAAALTAAQAGSDAGDDAPAEVDLDRFTWRAVAARVQAVYQP